MDHNSVRKINHKPYRKEVRILENILKPFKVDIEEINKL